MAFVIPVLGASLVVLILLAWRRLYPKPYSGIPYNERSANRITGDIPDLVPVIQASNEHCHAVFTVSTRRLGKPIAQLLFPSIRNPLIVLEDPREVEDVLVRRSKEFDKAPTTVDTFGPMFPYGTISQYNTPELKAQKRLWSDAVKPGFLRQIIAETGKLGGRDVDTCMMDSVLRRQVFEAKKTGVPLDYLRKDQRMLDEILTILVAGTDATASALIWFTRFMDTFTGPQAELRKSLLASFHPSSIPSAKEILDADIPYLDKKENVLVSRFR